MGYLMAQAKEGDSVQVHYTGTLESGKVFDTSEDKDALQFKIGEHKVIPGFEKGVIGMEEGQEKEVKIPPEEAYGQCKEDGVKNFPKTAFPPENQDKIKKGIMMGITSPEGHKMFARVLEVSGDQVKIDFNHPLAGKTLNFKIKLVKIM